MCFLHSVQLGLLDPRSEIRQAVWESPFKKIYFAKDFKAGFGVLGMDVIHEWKRLAIVPDGRSGEITIVI